MNTVMEHGENYKMYMLTPEEVMEKAQELLLMLAPAFVHSGGEIDECAALKMCAMEQATCFVGGDNGTLSALLIAEIMVFPLKTVCNVLGYAGKARDFYWFHSWLEQWAARQGATEMRGYGSEAAMRLACRHGYKEIYRVYAKPIGGEHEHLSKAS